MHIIRKILNIIAPPKPRVEELQTQKVALPQPRFKSKASVTYFYNYRDEVVSAALKAMKYDGYPNTALDLASDARELFDSLVEDIAPDAIIPTPLYKAREKERGFNQATLLLELLLLDTELLKKDWVVRVRQTNQQSSIKDKKERIENVLNAFAVIRPGLVADKTILVFDDIATTGATLHAVRAALLSAGAKEVYLCSLAG